MKDATNKSVDGYVTSRDPISHHLSAWIIYDDGGERQLPHLMKHSPTGFEQGYRGSGPLDLARSIIGHRLGLAAPPFYVYSQFAERVISRQYDDLFISIKDVDDFLVSVAILRS
jgi:hypothetical protein